MFKKGKNQSVFVKDLQIRNLDDEQEIYTKTVYFIKKCRKNYGTVTMRET